MKQKLCLVLALILVMGLALSGCKKIVIRNDLLSKFVEITPQTQPPAESVIEAPTEPATIQPPVEETTLPPTTEPPTTQPPTTEPPTTQPPTTKATQDSNLQQVKQHSFYIFAEPNYDADVVQPLPAGTYTIVKERYDEEGNLWGKLKSGLGWICLTDIQARKNDPIGIGEADKDLLRSGKYEEWGDPNAEYAIPVVIHGAQKLKDVTLWSTELGTAEMVPVEMLEYMETLSKGSYIVAWLTFPGDFSTYEISFTDKNGKDRSFQVATSGRNATLSVWEMK